MRYILLIHHDEGALAKAPQQELWAEYGAFNAALAKARSTVRPGVRLAPAAKAINIRKRDNGAAVVDGPYIDTKEQFAGYFLVDAADLDEAIAWAARCPSAKYGAIEIRPILDGISDEEYARRSA
jgi:hypothetical protein